MEDPSEYERFTAVVTWWEGGPNHLISIRTFLDLGIAVSGLPEGHDPESIYVEAHPDFAAEIADRLSVLGKPPPPPLVIVRDLTISGHSGS
jgi:hypothetical protein